MHIGAARHALQVLPLPLQMSTSFPAHRGSDKKKSDGSEYASAYDFHVGTADNVAEFLVAVEQVKILQDKVKTCYLKSGPNHFEDCKELREALWEKINTPNYGADGPPRSVRTLPHSSWARAPYFANADEQANLNDIVTTSLIGKPTFTAGVEFYEARFKRDRGDVHARALMANGGWTSRMSQGDVLPAKRQLANLRPDRRYESVVHLCKPQLYEP